MVPDLKGNISRRAQASFAPDIHMRSRASVLLLFVGLALLPMMAGCACARPAVSARGITDAPTSTGRGAFTLDIHILDGLTGAPLPGAGIVAYWGNDAVGSWSAPRVEVSGGAGSGSAGGRVVVDPGLTASSPQPSNTARLMSGPDGIAHARVPANIIIGIVAAKADYTEEWVPAVASGDSGAGALTITLLPSRIQASIEGAWGPGAASTGVVTSSSYAWKPAPAPFTNDSDTLRAFAARIVELKVTVTWNNTMQGYGDLGIGVGPDPARDPTYFRNPTRDAQPGEHTETATLSAQDLVKHGIVAAPAVIVGPAVDAGFLAPQGLAYSVRVDARFEGTGDLGFPCGGGQAGGRTVDDSKGVGAHVPGPEVGLLLAGVALMVLLSRRK